MFEGLNATLRPIGTWPGVPTKQRQWSRFRSSWTDTVKLLTRELQHLAARDVVLQLDYRERDLRQDGMPRADAKMGSPGVVIAFGSKHGALRYPCDRYTDWRDNVRAIAVTMERLRGVDFHGVTVRGEQYVGWKALPSSTTPAMSAEQAARHVAGLTSRVASDILASPGYARNATRQAVAACHPDNGGSHDAFLQVQEAKRVLGAHHGVSL